jgi:uncharacterized protein
MIIKRAISAELEQALSRQSAVALIGPRQSGKTTLAHEVASQRESIYIDLELKSSRDKLSDAELYLRAFQDKLVVLDEIHRLPDLFDTLRGLIDEGRRTGKRYGRFLLLGSASIDLLRQSGESLAGRIEYLELSPLSLLEIPRVSDEGRSSINHPNTANSLWLRGGFPDSFLSNSDRDSFRFRRNFIKTYLERDIPLLGPKIATETLERFWMMLAHSQGGLLNAARLASGLSVSAPTIQSYANLLVDLLLLRKLTPYHANSKKRLVKSPKLYIRDCGVLHALLNIQTYDELLGHPIVGHSWEGFVIETLLTSLNDPRPASFYRTTAGAEIDLVLELGGKHGIWVIEIKHGLSAKPTRGFYTAIEDIQPSRAFVVYSDCERYSISENVEAIGLEELAMELSEL